MPNISRDSYSKALIFKPTVEETHMVELTKSLKLKEEKLDSLISKLEQKLKEAP